MKTCDISYPLHHLLVIVFNPIIVRKSIFFVVVTRILRDQRWRIAAATQRPDQMRFNIGRCRRWKL